MSYLMRLLAQTSSLDPSEERWWSGVASPMTAAGVRVSPETALKLATVWACVGLLADAVAMLPLQIYRRLPDGGREPATNHPLYGVLHSGPNSQQTSFEFRQMLQMHLMLRGVAYAYIRPGPRGPVDQLVPIHPDRVTTETLPGGRLRYRVTPATTTTGPAPADNVPEVVNQEDMFRVMGLTLDGVTPLSVVSYARESFGLGLAAEAFGARFYGNNSQPGGALRKATGHLSEEAAKRLKSTWEASHSGANQHRVAILEDGLEWVQMGISQEDAQHIQTREFQAEDVCRWFRMPPHMIGLTSKATSWGTGIEQMSIGFVTYTLLPWLQRWEQAISRDLIIATDTYFAEFTVAALLMGDLTSRYNAYATARQWGWMSRNDIRRLENMNPIPGGDDYLSPTNMTTVGGPAPAQGPAGMAGGYFVPREQDARFTQLMQEAAGDRYLQFVVDAAGRIVRKEMAAMHRASRSVVFRPDGCDATFWAEVDGFYARHAEFVAEALHIGPDAAEAYCADQVRSLKSDGLETMKDWQTRRVADLAALALEVA